MAHPDIDDYAELFRLYGEGIGTAYLAGADDRYRLLFDQVCTLLVKESAFNAAMPQPFRWTARRYLAGDEATLAHMRQPDNRNFMLSDLADYVELRRRLRDRG